MANLERITLVSDIHGDGQCRETADALESHIKDWKPKLFCLGDLMDFRPFRKGACEGEKQETIRHDVDAGMRWLERFRPEVVTLGNHDDRVYDEQTANKNEDMQELCRGIVSALEGFAAKIDCKLMPYDTKPDSTYIHGGLAMTHGFVCSMYAAKATAERLLTPGTTANTIFAGHTHRGDTYYCQNGATGVIVPCSCELFPEYSDRKPASRQWTNGWVDVIHDTRTHRVEVTLVQRPYGERDFHAFTKVKTYKPRRKTRGRS